MMSLSVHIFEIEIELTHDDFINEDRHEMPFACFKT